MAEIKISSEDLATIFPNNSSEINQLAQGETIDKAEGLNLVKKLMKEKVQLNVDKEKQRLDPDGVRQRARKEVLSEVNSMLNDLGIEGNDWKEQINKLAETKTPESKENTEADIKQSEVYKRDITAIKDALQAEKDDHLKTKKSYLQKEEFQSIAEFAKGFLKKPENKYVKIEDQEVAKRRFDDFMRSLKDGDKRLTVRDGKQVVVDANGNIAQNENFDDITPEQFLANTAKFYYQKQVTEKKDALNIPTDKTAPPAGGKDFKIPPMKTEADLDKALDDNISSGGGGDRAKAIVAHYEATVAAAT